MEHNLDDSYQFGDCPICPFCGVKSILDRDEDDPEDVNFTECAGCGEEFKYTIHISWSYTSTKL